MTRWTALLKQLHQVERVGGCMAERGVIEDDPLFAALCFAQLRGQAAKESGVIGGVVSTWTSVQSPVAEAVPSAGRCGERGGLGRIGRDAGYIEAAQQAVDRRRKPACVARFQCYESAVQMLWMQLAECGEELVRESFVEGKTGRELNEERAELVAEAADLLEEIGQ